MTLASLAGDRQHGACAWRTPWLEDSRDGACASKESDAMMDNTPSHAHEAHRDRLENATVRPQYAPLCQEQYVMSTVAQPLPSVNARAVDDGVAQALDLLCQRALAQHPEEAARI